jgi:hypothetical protein
MASKRTGWPSRSLSCFTLLAFLRRFPLETMSSSAPSEPSSSVNPPAQPIDRNLLLTDVLYRVQWDRTFVEVCPFPFFSPSRER